MNINDSKIKVKKAFPFPGFVDDSFNGAVDNIAKTIQKYLERGSKILDLGCGSGMHASCFTSLGYDVTGLDNIEKIHFDDFKYVNCDISKNKIPFNNDTFDVIFCKSVIEHILYPEEFLNNCMDVLKPGGKILVVSFHSIEDKIVKYFFRSLSENKSVSRYQPKLIQSEPLFLMEHKKPIIPSKQELNQNISSRSAKLRFVIKKRSFHNFDTDIFEKFKFLIDIENISNKL